MALLDLSPVGLFFGAGLVGKGVMAVLFMASLWCWVLIVEGIVSAARVRRAVRAARGGGEIGRPLAAVVAAGEAEAHRRIPGETVSEVRARIADSMARAARELLTRAEGGLPNLAVISSVAPFVGLFGTVWGIMSSFAAIAEAQDTSLATVAPGIAESLAATAYGLAAAIPASIGYNRIGAAYARLGQEMASFVEERATLLISRPAEVAREAGPRRRGGALMAMKPQKIGEGLYQPLAEINVTPLVDVMLVLLIIFMVTAPMLATGIKVNLPGARTAEPLAARDPVIVAVAKDGAVSVGKDFVARDSLVATVKARLASSNGVVQLRGDKDAAYGDVVAVMDDLAAGGHDPDRDRVERPARRAGRAGRCGKPMRSAALDGRGFEARDPAGLAPARGDRRGRSAACGGARDPALCRAGAARGAEGDRGRRRAGAAEGGRRRARPRSRRPPRRPRRPLRRPPRRRREAAAPSAAPSRRRRPAPPAPAAARAVRAADRAAAGAPSSARAASGGRSAAPAACAGRTRRQNPRRLRRRGARAAEAAAESRAETGAGP